MNSIIEILCQKHGLTIVRKFQLGNVCKAVFLVQDTTRKILVLKVGTDQRGIAEIQKNRVGYERLVALGLDFFIPQIQECEINEDFAVLLMEYCGEDVLTQIKRSSNPAPLYDILMDRIETIYQRSKHKGDAGMIMVKSVLRKVKEQYDKYLQIVFDPSGDMETSLLSLNNFLSTVSLPYYCFSNWDFTPDDVYLTSEGIKYSDPHEDVTGIPIIDLACFAGVALAHELPGSVDAYNRLEKFAIQRVGGILEIEEQPAKNLFILGRLLQCFLSARFRIKEFPEQATRLFGEAKGYLEKITTF